MSKKRVSSRSKGSSPRQQTLDVLHNKLVTVEGDANQLSQQLKHMGFDSNGQTDKTSGQKSVRFSTPKHSQQGLTLDTITPFKANIADTEVLHKNYDGLVSRVCHMESTIQGLKLNLAQANAQRDFSKKEKLQASDQLSLTAETYDKELSKLTSELTLTRKELVKSEQLHAEAENTVNRLQQVVDDATSAQSTMTLNIGEVQSTKSKLQRRNKELKDELSRETSLRTSLEESHNTLLTRIQEMDARVQTERDQVQTMSENCSQLKKETIQAREESKLQHELRINAESQLLNFQSELDSRQAKVTSLEEDKRLLMDEIRKLQKQYMELNGQIDNMTDLFNDKQLGMLEKAVKLQTEENLKQIEDQLRTEMHMKTQAKKKKVPTATLR